MNPIYINILAADQLHFILPCKETVGVATHVDAKEEKMDSGSTELPKEEGLSINIENFKNLTKNNSLVIQKLILMTIESFNCYKEEYKFLLEKRDAKGVGLLSHKLKLTSNLLSAHNLENIIGQTREMLVNGNCNDFQIQEAISNIHKEFDLCNRDLMSALKEFQ
ncbi:MAG: hypothetical protein M3512_02160 [Bacteroidota bacterium]|nr:hypothetical protein [Bacteroidota bacterium]